MKQNLLGLVVQRIIYITMLLRCQLVEYIMPTTLSNTLLFFVGKMNIFPIKPKCFCNSYIQNF